MSTPTGPEPSPLTLVSIAMCTYNGERFLRKQLDSLINQNHRPLEIIIVDDGSTDTTCSIIQEYANQNSFIHFYQNKQNLGYVKNFEKALSLCSGDYIALCDQDDIWLPEKLSTQLENIGDASLTYSELSYIDENDRPLNAPPRKTNRLAGRCPLALLFGTCVTGHLALLKREVLDHALPFPEGIRAHDHWIPFVASAINGLKPTDHILSLYRSHGHNVSMKSRKKMLKNPFTRIKERKAAFNTKLKGRLQFLQAAKNSGLLSENETALVSDLIREHSKLTSCIQNRMLHRLLSLHADLLLKMYKRPEKILSRLVKGKRYFQLTLYAKKA